MSLKHIICLMGPTASGKTQLAVELVKQFPFEIISVDSAMVYRGLDIGTAKPSQAILEKAPHRLIDIRDPAEPYSAAQFCEDAEREIKDIFSKNKIPLLVGGTMLYFRALQQGLSALPGRDDAIREKLNAEGALKGWPELHARLQTIDPDAASRIHPHDSQRIQRALEVYELTGESLSVQQKKEALMDRSCSFINLAIAPFDRAILHDRIRQRFDEMLAQGFLDEVQTLFKRNDLNLTMSSIRSVGYRQAWEYLSGGIDYDTMRERTIVATRQLAKRQLTWLRHWPDIISLESESPDLLQQTTNYLYSIKLI